MASRKLETAVVGIGASAGGVAALKHLVPKLPKGRRFAYVVALHMDPTQPSLLVEILEKESAMPVKMVVDGEKLLPGTVYVVPPNHDCAVHGGKFRLLDLPEKTAPRHSIDVLFASLADSYGEHGAGIVLSGTGSDGMHGMLALKTAGGIAIAQDPETTEYASMPQSVIDAGLADLVLPPAQMGRALGADGPCAGGNHAGSAEGEGGGHGRGRVTETKSGRLVDGPVAQVELRIRPVQGKHPDQADRAPNGRTQAG
jgi:two-component system CheB/CheR fusion protein